MAQPVMCDSEDGRPGVLLVTNLGNGDTQALCAQCLPGWLAAVYLSVAGEPLPATEAPPVPPDAEGEARTGDARGRRSARGRGRAAAATEPTEATPLAGDDS